MVGLVHGVRAATDSGSPSVEARPLRPSSWWLEPSKLLKRFSHLRENSRSCDWYRIVDGFLGVDSEDLPLRQRFRTLYAELLSEPPSPSEATPWVRCHIQVQDGLPARLVTFTAPSAVAIIDFLLALFSHRGYVEMDHAAGGWRSIAFAGRASPLLTARGGEGLGGARETWQAPLGDWGGNWGMQLQPQLLFFHPAAVGIRRGGGFVAGGK